MVSIIFEMALSVSLGGFILHSIVIGAFIILLSFALVDRTLIPLTTLRTPYSYDPLEVTLSQCDPVPFRAECVAGYQTALDAFTSSTA